MENCSALCKPPVSLYLRPPNTSDEWKKVSDKNVNNVKQARRNQCSRRQTYCSGFFQRFRNPWLWLQKFLWPCAISYLCCKNVGQYNSKNDSKVLIKSEMVQKFEERSFDFPEVESLERCLVRELVYCLVGDEIFSLKLQLIRP